MDPYYCIISTLDEAVADLCVLQAATDQAALRRAREIVRGWTGLEKVEVYQGERRIASLHYAQPSDDLRAAA